MINGWTADGRDSVSDRWFWPGERGNGMLVVNGFAPCGHTPPSAWPGQTSSAATGNHDHDESMIDVGRLGLGRRIATVTMRPS